jgi:hypothetical protein
MTLLEEFVFSLNRTERRKLRPLRFRGVKRKIFLKILGWRKPDEIDFTALIKSNKLTRKQYNQMCSEILAACYTDVAALGGTDLLQYLGNRQLYRHFYKEMRRQENSLRKTESLRQLEDFYFKVLLMSEFFLIPPHLAGNMRKEIAQYLHRYVKVKRPHPSDEWLLRSAEIEEEISQNFARDFSLEKLRALTDELEEMLARPGIQDHALARFKAAYTLAMIYFGNYFKDKKPDPYIEYVVRIADEHPEIFGYVGELVKLGVRSYSAPKDQEIEQYKHFLLHPSPTGEGSSLLFIERFLPFVIKAGELQWAKRFIADHFPNNIDQLRKDISVHWWRLLLIYHVYAGEYAKAEDCLQKAFTANTGKNRNIDVDINLRCFGVFLSIIKGGPELASAGVNRHIRYAYVHGYNRDEGFMMMFLKAILDLVSHPSFDKLHAAKVREKYLRELGSEERLYPLFEKIYRKFFA